MGDVLEASLEAARLAADIERTEAARLRAQRDELLAALEDIHARLNDEIEQREDVTGARRVWLEAMAETARAAIASIKEQGDG